MYSSKSLKEFPPLLYIGNIFLIHKIKNEILLNKISTSVSDLSDDALGTHDVKKKIP